MNKIYVDKEEYELIIKENGFYSLEIKAKTNLKLTVLENLAVSVNILIDNAKVNINLNILNNSKVKINQLGINTSCNILTKVGENSLLDYSDSILTKVNSLNKIELNLAKNTTCNFYANGVNLNNSKFYFEIDGNIAKDSNNVFLSENSKIINLEDGDSKIIPNLIVDNKEVSASHSAFVGTFREDDINYLKSRGLDTNQAKKLLLKSILLGGMTFEFEKDKFTDIIINNEY